MNISVEQPVNMALRRPAQRGIKIVHSVPPKVMPIAGAPLGKIRLQFRAGQAAKVFVKTDSGISSMLLEDRGETWLARPDLFVGRNDRRCRAIAHLPGAIIRKFRTFQFK